MKYLTFDTHPTHYPQLHQIIRFLLSQVNSPERFFPITTLKQTAYRKIGNRQNTFSVVIGELIHNEDLGRATSS